MLRKNPSSSPRSLRAAAGSGGTAKSTRSGRNRRRKIGIDDLRALRTVGSPRISPDGSQVVYSVAHTEQNESVSNLWMADADGGEPRPFTHGGKDSKPAWSPDGTQVAFVSGREKQRPQIGLIPVAGGEARTLTDFPEGSLAGFRWSPNGKELAVAFRPQAPEWTTEAVEQRKRDGLSDPPRVLDDPWYRLDGDGYFNGQRFALYMVDADTGQHRLLYDKDRLGLFSFAFSPDGKRLVLGSNRHKHAFAKAWTAELLLLDVRTGKIRAVRGLPDGRKESVSWSPDGKRLAWASMLGDDGTVEAHNVHVFTCDVSGRNVKDVMARGDQCIMAPTISDTGEVEFEARYAWAPDGKRLWLQLGWHGETQLATVSARGGPLRYHTSGKAQHLLGNLSDDGKRVALAVSDATHPAEVHVGDTATRLGPRGKRAKSSDGTLALRAISHVNARVLSQLQLSRPTAHWVRSADGTKVHTWVMRPPGASKRTRRPAILEIHGGPACQYGWTFFHEFQVLAAQGYIVVYSNPRGSKGYGQALCDGNSDCWGTTDWADLEAVTAFMKQQADVDSSRLGIMGGSFGGYMTLWAIGHSREYRAAIADRCVSNMVAMWGSSDIYVWPDSYFSGNTWDRTESLWNMSPLKFMGKVKTPTLLIHSEGDLRCNIAESEQVYAALSMRGVPTRFVRYPANTSHGMSRGGPPDMRVHRLGQIVEWWKRWMEK